MPQSQISNCAERQVLLDFENIARRPHGNRTAADQFERWQFILETPPGAFSWFRKEVIIGRLQGDF